MNWTVGIRSGQGKHETESETDGARSTQHFLQKTMNVHRLLRVLHLESRFWTNGNGNSQTIHRSNRFHLRNTNMRSISSIDKYPVRIERMSKWRRNFNRGLLTQSLTKLQITSFKVIYNRYSIKSLTRFKLLRDAKSNLLECSTGGTAVELRIRANRYSQSS